MCPIGFFFLGIWTNLGSWFIRLNQFRFCRDIRTQNFNILTPRPHCWYIAKFTYLYKLWRGSELVIQYSRGCLLQRFHWPGQCCGAMLFSWIRSRWKISVSGLLLFGLGAHWWQSSDNLTCTIYSSHISTIYTQNGRKNRYTKKNTKLLT